MKCPKCGLEHSVEECRPEDGHTDGQRYLVCRSARGGCSHHWQMTKAQASILDQEYKLTCKGVPLNEAEIKMIQGCDVLGAIRSYRARTKVDFPAANALAQAEVERQGIRTQGADGKTRWAPKG